MDEYNFLTLSAVDFGIQWFLWIFSALFHTEKFYDLAGSATFVILTLLSYFTNVATHPRRKVQTIMIVIWGIRLGSYLFTRILAEGRDPRFDKARDSALILLVFWTMQGVWVLITLFPSLLMLFSKKQPSLGYLDYIGWALWVIGFLFEAVADHQKSQFRKNLANQGTFITTGLWSLSRHPNYFGEMMLWFGLFISASTTFSHCSHYLSIGSPLFVCFLISFISGIPLLESHALKKYGGTPKYELYVQNTPILIPKIF